MKRTIKNIVKYGAFAFGFMVFSFIVIGIILTLAGVTPETPVEEKESVKKSDPQPVQEVEEVKEVSEHVEQKESLKKTDEVITKITGEETKETVQENSTKDKIDPDFRLQFSLWNGSHDKTVKYVKSKMHNPKSFEHVETQYIDYAENGFRVINMKYRGTNLNNAVVTQTIWVNVDLEGNITKVLKHQ